MTSRILCAALFAASLLVGCGSDNHGAPPHTPDEEKALQEYNKLTPEQQIERAQNSPQPQGAKDALIKSIKEKNGIK